MQLKVYPFFNAVTAFNFSYNKYLTLVLINSLVVKIYIQSTVQIDNWEISIRIL